MARYKYRATDQHGNQQSGTAEAESPEELVTQLRQSGLTVSFVEEVVEGPAFRKLLNTPSSEEMAFFSQQLSTLVATQLPLAPSLAALSREASSRTLRRALEDTSAAVSEGQTFSQALSRHAGVFPDLFVHIVEAGEASGNLPAMLQILARYSRTVAQIGRKVRAMLYYPIAVLIAAAAVLLLIACHIIPGFAQMFVDMDLALPGSTRLVLSVSNLLTERGGATALTVGIVLGLLLATWAFLRGTPAGRLMLDRMKLSLPFVGRVTQTCVLLRFFRSLASLLQAGVPMTKALPLSGRCGGNALLDLAVREIHGGVAEGGTFSEQLAELYFFPNTLTLILATAEKSGRLPEELGHLADIYEDKLQGESAWLAAFLAVALIVVLGVVVGFVVLSLFLPLYNLLSMLGG